MASTGLGILRRRGHAHAAGALVASGSRIRMDSRGDAQLLMRSRQDWQQAAFNYLRNVGELHYVANYLGDALSRLRIFAAEIVDADQEPVASEDPAAIRETARLDNGAGWAGIMRKAVVNMVVVGECFLVGEFDELTLIERWGVKSINELRVTGAGNYQLYDYDGAEARDLGKSEAHVIRIWNESAEYSALADSPTRSVLEHLEALVFLEKAKRAQAKSRISMGQILKVPNELAGHGPANPNLGNADGEERKDPMMAQLEEAFVTPIQDEGSAAAVMPILVRGPMEALKGLERLTFDRPFDPQLDAAIDRAITRFAQGMPVPPEIVKGIADVNHWNGFVIDESTFKHMEPLGVTILDAITDGYYRPALVKAGVKDVSKHLLWYDPSRVVQHPNRATDAKDAHDRIAISDESLRKVLGFGDADKPTDQEVIMRTGLKAGRIDPALGSVLLEQLLKRAGLEPPIVVSGAPAIAPGPTPPAPAPEPTGLPVNAPPGTSSAVAEGGDAASERPLIEVLDGKRNLGRRLVDIDLNLRSRLIVAADAAMRRAIEKAGARVRTKATAKQVGAAQRALVASCPASEVCEKLGPALVAQLDPPTDPEWLAAFAMFRSQFDRWVAEAQEAALSKLPNLTESRVADLEYEQEAARTAAWEWMSARLVALSKERLYSMTASLTAAAGEADPSSLVPTGLIRKAMAIAGGSDPSELGELSGFALAAPAEEGSLGGTALGDTVRMALVEEGIVTESWEWVYGPFPRKTFEPHRDLDGIIFSNWDDAVLSNREGFPDAAFFYPGDHGGAVLPGTIVEGPLATGAALRHYDGEVVRLRTKSGQLLTATPHHPILTDHGWVGAGELHEGDHVVRSLGRERISGLVPYDYDVPALVEERTYAFAVTPGMVAACMPVAPEDFDGDGRGSEIAVVWTHRNLRPRLYSTLGDHHRELGLGLPDLGRAVTFAGLRPGDEGSERIWSAALRRVRRANDRLALLRREAGPVQTLSLAPAPWLDAGSHQPFVDRSATGAEMLGEGLDALAGGVELDELVDVDRYTFSGHVYDLQTEVRWYIANGIVVHNCVCDVAPVLVGPQIFPEPVLASAGAS